MSPRIRWGIVVAVLLLSSWAGIQLLIAQSNTLQSELIDPQAVMLPEAQLLASSLDTAQVHAGLIGQPVSEE